MIRVGDLGLDLRKNGFAWIYVVLSTDSCGRGSVLTLSLNGGSPGAAAFFVTSDLDLDNVLHDTLVVARGTRW